MSGPRVYLRHARAAGHCRSGIVRHLAAHGWTLRDLCKEGIDAAEMKRVGSPQMRTVADLALAEGEKRAGANGQKDT